MELTESVERCVDVIVARVGSDLRVGTPLGLGKPNHLLNALYRRARRDPGLRLTVYTALTLQRPQARRELEGRLLDPVVERVYGNYPDLDYELDRAQGRLPPNVRVHEFFMQAGKYLDSPQVQRDYISTNYTYVARDLASRGVNVLMQQMAVETGDDGRLRLSLSSNADVSPDLMRLLADDPDVVAVCQTSGSLPFMPGDAEVSPGQFDVVVHDPGQDHTQFSIPKTDPLSDADTMIGLYASTLVRDGGALQLGIGSLGDALASALCLRQQDNAHYRKAVEQLDVEARAGEALSEVGSLHPFERGLFAATEMLVDAFQPLWEAGILSRRVYDDEILQGLLNEGRIDEDVTPDTLRLLVERGAVGSTLSEKDVTYLRHFGVFRPEVRLDGAELEIGERRLSACLDDPGALQEVCAHCLGTSLSHGAVAHASFFLGRPSFYAWLRSLPEAERARIQMRPVTRVNQLYGHETLGRLQRTRARFLNTAMLATLSGSVVSDGLEDGRVVSGVGGQHDFVAMGHALPDGHSILQLRATREVGGRPVSNIRSEYAHTTLPRHQRDILVTEYGVAMLRGKTDEEVAQAVIQLADSRFQPELVRAAKRRGKLAPSYEVPPPFRDNVPAAYQAKLGRLRQRGAFARYPFGSDLTDQERVLAAALRRLEKLQGAPGAMLHAIGTAALRPVSSAQLRPYLKRMGLDAPRSPREWVQRGLLETALRLEHPMDGPSESQGGGVATPSR